MGWEVSLLQLMQDLKGERMGWGPLKDHKSPNPFPDSYPFLLCLLQLKICHWHKWTDIFPPGFPTSSLTFPDSSITDQNLLQSSPWSLNITFLMSGKLFGFPLSRPPGLDVHAQVCVCVCVRQRGGRERNRVEEGEHTWVFLSKCLYGKVRGWPGVSDFPFLFTVALRPVWGL